VNSRQKGKRGELELAAWLRERGIEARRGVQYQGGAESPDLVTALDGYHIECKRTERLSLYDAIEQARADALDGQTPLVLHRRNRGRWLAILDAEDLLRLIRHS